MNRIIAITGPSGVGKSTLGDMLSEEFGYIIPRHCTTRDKRKDDKDEFYRYLSHEEYSKKLENNKFLISSGDGPKVEKIYGNFYGVLKDDCKKCFKLNNTIILFVSYRDIDSLLELKKNKYNIDIVNLKFSNIEKGIMNRLLNNNKRNQTKNDIESRILNAIELDKQYGEKLKLYSSSIIYTDQLNIEEMYKKVCDDLNLTKKYYIGFKSNNAICNESYFNGSITLYPTHEKGNIYFSNKTLNDTNSKQFFDEYKKYICKQINNIKNAKFLIFNKKIIDLLEDLKDINLIYNKNYKLIESLNNKFKTRNKLKEIVPMLDYIWIDSNDINYYKKINNFKCDSFVLQGIIGSGGDNTYLIKNKQQLDTLNLNGKYCISKYTYNIPLNITLIIGKDSIIHLPISAQLIQLIDNKFKYVGGDFIFPQSLDDNIIKKINVYSENIAKKLRNDGYLGIIGIDYILTEENDVFFMELNPRFQSSSFLINLYLDDYGTSLAELHCLALEENNLPKIEIKKINHSFLNCDQSEDYNEFINYSLIKNGYSKNINGLIYRKLFKYSLINNKKFQNLNNNLQKM